MAQKNHARYDYAQLMTMNSDGVARYLLNWAKFRENINKAQNINFLISFQVT
jgi:histidinol phosphatase-like enzyme